MLHNPYTNIIKISSRFKLHLQLYAPMQLIWERVAPLVCPMQLIRERVAPSHTGLRMLIFSCTVQSTGYRVPNRFTLSNMSTLPFWYQENIIFLEARYIKSINCYLNQCNLTFISSGETTVIVIFILQRLRRDFIMLDYVTRRSE